ncbi:hypothetical protein VPH35_084626 [Triticum aestivum]
MASMILLGAVIILLNLASMSLAQPKHRCRTHCGDIEIPYPCGIAIGCAIEQRFEVNCSRTVDGIERPFIHEQEVLNISASRGQSRVLMTIPSYCYNSSTAKMDLRPWDFYLAWPYRFSDVQNKFISIGCNSMGYIYTGKSRYVAGCISVCWSPDELANGSCVGIGCCQNTITMGLTSYHAVFYDVDYLNSTTSWHFNPCGYSMVVEAENFVFNSVYNHDKVASRNMSSYACRTGNTVCVNSPNGLGYLCNCSSGYQGNPYLSNGCTVGGYHCLCPFGGNFAKETNSCTNGLIGVIIGLSCGTGVLFIALISTLLVRRWNQGIKSRVRKAHFRRNKGLFLEQLISSDESAMHSTEIFSLDGLEKATGNFDSTRILGLGEHGTVYKGILLDRRVVAIKKSKLSEVPLLVYEFISNGALSEILHGDNLSSRISLTWDDRIIIASEASSALAYLHSAASIPIFHRDVKSANILLTHNFSAKVADFGASRSISIDETRVVTAVQGTFGYLDPEYYHTGQLTEKSDVYSFGVIIVEPLTRKKSIFLDSHSENKNLCHYFVQRQQDNTIKQIVDVQVLEEGTERQIDEMASLAMACLKHRGEERPTMKEVEPRLQAMRGKMVMKRNHELERHGEAVTLLPSNYSNYFSTSFGAANSSNQCVTRCCTMERELVSWTDLPR